jgi:hypothetical protein
VDALVNAIIVGTWVGAGIRLMFGYRIDRYFWRELWLISVLFLLVGAVGLLLVWVVREQAQKARQIQKVCTVHPQLLATAVICAPILAELPICYHIAPDSRNYHPN